MLFGGPSAGRVAQLGNQTVVQPNARRFFRRAGGDRIVAAKRQRQNWSDLSASEQRGFVAIYARTGNLKAAVDEYSLRPVSANAAIERLDIEGLVKDIRVAVQEQIVTEETDWCVKEIERIDDLLNTLYEGKFQLTARATIADINALVRLKLLLMGKPDSRQEVNLNGSARDKLTERLEAYVAQQSSDSDDGGPD